MREWSEEEYEKETERLGWAVEYLKVHLRKEERIKKVSKKEDFSEKQHTLSQQKRK